MGSKQALVTGADGFIGSHLVEVLVRRGWEVRAVVLYNSQGTWGWVEDLPPAIRNAVDVAPGDVRDGAWVREVARGCEVVFHLAALIAIPYSYRAPESYVATNVVGTLNVLQAARDAGATKVVHTSTSEVYGTARFVPITEEHPLQPQSPYSASKVGADSLAVAFHRSFGTPVAIARPFNTYGPRQSARAVIPTIISQIAGGADTIRLGSLHPTRDFSYVADTVAGLVAVAEAEGSVGRVINLGSGFEISIGELAALIARKMGREISILEEEQRIRPEASEIERLLADNRLAREITGWRPAYVGTEGLGRGLEDTIKWFRDPANLRRYKADLYNV